MKNHNAIIFDLLDVLFFFHEEKRDTKEMFSVLKPGLEILLKCHAQLNAQGERKYKLYVLSNATSDSHANLITNHPEIFAYFDGIVTSSSSGYQKPDAKAFYYLIDRYKLDPKQCIFIDDKKVNVLTARAVGMHGIVCDSHDSVKKELQKLSII